MKRVILSLLFILTAIILVLGLSSCGGVEYSISFVVDGEPYATVKAGENEFIAAPENPIKDGYIFDGWYWDNGVWEKPLTTTSLLDAPISSDMRVFAKWNCIHTPTDWITVVSPTCKDEGEKHKTCSKCNQILESASIDKLPTHTPDDPVVEELVDSCCDTEGSFNLTVYCSVCDIVISTEARIVEKKPHTEVIDPAVAPTCTEEGLSAGSHCAECNKILTAQVAVPTVPHTEVIDPAVAPTCTEEGLSAGSHCAECGSVIISQNAISALGHSASEDEYKAPTCTEDGWSAGATCEVCGELLVARDKIPALGHTYVAASVAPTCTEKGYTIYTCHCGDSYAGSFVDANGHVRLTIDPTPPTCTAAGLTVGVYCSVCDTVLVEQTVLSAMGHVEVVDNAVLPTCTDTGLTVGAHCSVCNDTLVPQQVVPALGHTEINDPAVAPTCTEDGLTAGTHCSVCNEALTAQIQVPALGHTACTTPASAPTCTEPGYTESEYCTVCGATLRESEAIAPIPHVYDRALATENYKISDATEESAATYNKSCACGARGTEIFTIGTALPPTVKRITLDSTTAEIYVNQPFLLTAVVAPESADADLTWTSSDESVATVNEGGAVTAISVGMAVITVTDKCGVSASCTVTVKADEIKFTLTDDASFYYVSGYDGYDAHIEIPNIYNGLRVIGIAESAFRGNTLVESIIIPNSIEFIGAHAFEGCTSLGSFTLPQSVTEIAEYTFFGCTSLAEIILGAANSRLASIGSYAFFGCTALTALDISDSAVRLDSIGDHAFSYCSALSSVNLPDSVRMIGQGAFEYCTSLAAIDLGESLTAIADMTFDHCTALISLRMPDTVVTVGNMALRQSIALREVYLSSGLSGIGAAAFQHCSGLKAVTIPAGVKFIGNSAFSGCDGIESIVILGDITSWGDSAFYECYAVEYIYIASRAVSVVPEDNYAFYNVGAGTDGITLVLGKSAVIPEYLFSPVGDVENYPRITSITVEGGATEVNAFGLNSRLPYLTAISLPDSIESITYGIFNSSPWWDAQQVGEVYIDNILYGYKCECYMITPDEILVWGFSDADCLNAGSYEMSLSCSVCGLEVLRRTVTIPPYGHDLIDHEPKNQTCLDIGWNAYRTCGRCDYSTYREIPAQGHRCVTYAAKAPGCEDIGWEQYEACGSCSYTTYIEIPALGHDYIANAPRDPDCDSIGWEAYTSCSRCDYTTYKERPSLGHKVIVTEKVEQTCTNYTTQNDEKYPFNISDSVITSTNKSSNSSATFTITALRSFTLSLEYRVSSEDLCDHLIIKLNRDEVVKTSGTSVSSYTVLSVPMNEGDTLTVTYTKDMSNSVGNDCAFVRLLTESTESILIDVESLVNATDEVVAALLLTADSVVCESCNDVIAEKNAD